MSEMESRRLALYNGLIDLLGAELTDTLMDHLPVSTDIATKTDIHHLEDEVRRVSERIDKMQHTMLAGFVAMVAALIGSGLLG